MRNRYLRNVVPLELNEEKCTGCGKCMEVCPHNVFGLYGGKARIIDRDACMECGACSVNCPFAAIEVKAGVGCAAAMIAGVVSGNEPGCGCSEEGCC